MRLSKAMLRGCEIDPVLWSGTGYFPPHFQIVRGSDVLYKAFVGACDVRPAWKYKLDCALAKGSGHELADLITEGLGALFPAINASMAAYPTVIKAAREAQRQALKVPGTRHTESVFRWCARVNAGDFGPDEIAAVLRKGDL